MPNQTNQNATPTITTPNTVANPQSLGIPTGTTPITPAIPANPVQPTAINVSEYMPKINELMMYVRRLHLWRGNTIPEKEDKFRFLNQKMNEITGKNVQLIFQIPDPESEIGNGRTDTINQSITMEGKFSLLTFLHEWGHIFGMDEIQASEWSNNIFKTYFPHSWQRLQNIGTLQDTMMVTERGANTPEAQQIRNAANGQTGPLSGIPFLRLLQQHSNSQQNAQQQPQAPRPTPSQARQGTPVIVINGQAMSPEQARNHLNNLLGNNQPQPTPLRNNENGGNNIAQAPQSQPTPQPTPPQPSVPVQQVAASEEDYEDEQEEARTPQPTQRRRRGRPRKAQ